MFFDGIIVNDELLELDEQAMREFVKTMYQLEEMPTLGPLVVEGEDLDMVGVYFWELPTAANDAAKG